MNPEDFIEAEDVTSSFCLFVLMTCILVSVFLFPRMRINSPLAQAPLPIVPEQAMVGVRNPFSFNILSPDEATIKSGIKLQVKASLPSELQAFWVVDCSSLQKALKEHSLQLIQDPSSILQDCFLDRSDQIVLNVDIETEISLMLADSVADSEIQASLGPPPRSLYPLCLVVRSLQDQGPEDSQPDIVGAMYIVHVPDDQFCDPCHLIAQLLVSNTGQVCHLQKLYMSDEETQTPEVSANQDSNSFQPEDIFKPSVTQNIRDSVKINSASQVNNVNTEDRIKHGCVVCQNRAISIALLPCRHTCICWSCFPLLNRCPMCRGCIESYFLLNCQTATDVVDDEDDDWAMKLNNACERLNRWLGLDN